VLQYFLQQGVNALSNGSLYAMMAVGLALIFSILRLINFAHGDLMMIAVYLFVFAGFAGIPIVPALVIMVGGSILIGLSMERVAYRPLRGGPEVALLLSSFAVGQILQNSALLVSRVAGQPIQISFPAPALLSGAVSIGPLLVPRLNIASFVIGTVLLVLLTLFVTRTRLGLSMQAVAEDLPAARLMGIRINRVVMVAFAIASGLAAVAGYLYASQAGQINPYLGFTPVLKAFIAAVIGGFGSLSGAVVGAYLLAFLEVIPTTFAGIADILPAGTVSPEVHDLLKQVLPSALGSWRDAFVFVFLILMLLFRPNGILRGGAREETP
jgi:branched-chain amino acid transport system permease protein